MRFEKWGLMTWEVYFNINHSFRKQITLMLKDIKKKIRLHSKILVLRVGNQTNQNNNRGYTFHVWKGSECSVIADESSSE